VAISLLTNHFGWTDWSRRPGRENGTAGRGSTRGLIEAGDAEEPYQDEPFAAQESGTNHDQGPILATSFLQNESDNAWRGEGEGTSHRA